MLDRLESNGVRTVIVERADRFARDLMVQEVIVGQFAKIGARILTADGVDLTSPDDDPTRRLIRQVLGAVAEFEKRILVELAHRQHPAEASGCMLSHEVPMKRAVRLLMLVATALVAVPTFAQGTRTVTLSLDLPNGGHPLMKVNEGGLATIELRDVGTFAFRPTVRDSSAGTVTVAIFSGATADSPLLAEVDTTVGGPAVRSDTTPSFGIAITRIAEQ